MPSRAFAKMAASQAMENAVNAMMTRMRRTKTAAGGAGEETDHQAAGGEDGG